MTTHGAKGLEAPIVFIPDATDRKARPKTAFIARNEAGDAVWASGLKFSKTAEPFKSVFDRAAVTDLQEYHRLLYVALTRAKDKLYITGYRARSSNGKGLAKIDENSWYHRVRVALDSFSETEYVATGDQEAEDATILRYADSRIAAASEEETPDVKAEKSVYAPPPLPDFFNRPPPLLGKENAGDGFKVSPSAAVEEKVYDFKAAKRGERVHKLLELLPALAPDSRLAAGKAYLIRAGLRETEAEALTTEAIEVMNHPDCRGLFSPDALIEVAVTGKAKALGGETLISGRIDRMAPGETEVLVADFKTGADILQKNVIPEKYVTQAALYCAALRDLYPKHEIKYVIIATAGPRVFPIPDSRLQEALRAFKAKNEKSGRAA